MLRLALIGITAFVCSVGFPPAAQLRVPQLYHTIQSAIDAASDGDTVIVAPGLYYENIDFLGKAITVQSTDPSDPAVVHATIIDGSGADCVTFRNNEDERSVLRGMSLTNGLRGVYCHWAAHPTIHENTITGTLSSSSIYCRNACGVVDGNTMDRSISIYGTYGTGIVVRRNITSGMNIWADFQRNGPIVIEENVVIAGSGGIIVEDSYGSSFPVTVSRNIIDGRWGISIYSYNKPLVMTIAGNLTRGGALPATTQVPFR